MLRTHSAENQKAVGGCALPTAGVSLGWRGYPGDTQTVGMIIFIERMRIIAAGRPIMTIMSRRLTIVKTSPNSAPESAPAERYLTTRAGYMSISLNYDLRLNDLLGSGW
jgi:hypothetical protein